MYELCDNISVWCVSSFWKNNKYLEYLSAEIAKEIYLGKKSWRNWAFWDRGVRKWFGLTLFEAILLYLGWMLNNCYLSLSHSEVYTSLPSRWELPDGFTEPFVRRVAIPLRDSRLYTFLANVEVPYTVEHIYACRCFVCTNCRWTTVTIRRCNAFSTHEPRDIFLPKLLAFILGLLAMCFDR
jgi:hypothetical protein